jgi:squalene synthase HpnC
VVIESTAYSACLRVARQHYENFPVASRLVPRDMRPHLAAIYAFARVADDFADEESRSDAARLALLDDWARRLRTATRASETRPGVSSPPSESTSDSMTGAIFVALAATIRRCHLDVQLFEDLLSAFRQDVLVKRYDTWDRLLDYCRRSANPVGRLVLSVAGCRDPELFALSDAVCTALQITNFCQDLERDWAKGRLYVPATIMSAHSAREDQLDRRPLAPAWRAALRDVGSRTRELFEAGRPIAGRVDGRLRWELRMTWLAGMRVLNRLERGGFDVFRERPSLGWRDAAPLAWQMLTWR